MRVDPIIIRATELVQIGMDPRQWALLPFSSQKSVAAIILSNRQDDRSSLLAQLLEQNNPNVTSKIRFAWDLA